jgi:hypothetical protein
MELRPYQLDAAERLLATRDKRLILHHSVGAGKTATAIHAAKQLGAESILVIAPALARPVWQREFNKWWPESGARSVRFGRTRKSLTIKQAVERDEAWAAKIQIISYELAAQLLPIPYDLVIIDELHNLGSPLSKQSKVVRKLFQNAPPRAALGLTATLYRTELKQLWCPLDLFWPEEFGKQTATKNIAYSFLQRYTHVQENDYGKSWNGSRNLPELQKRIGNRVHRVVEADFARFLPPLFAEIMYLDERRDNADVFVDWIADRTDARRIGVFTYLHASQAELVEAERGKTTLPVYVINGSQTVEERVRLLEDAAANPDGCIVFATVDSVRESLSLSFLKSALVFEWRTSPASAVQFLGRFARADSVGNAPTYVQYVAQPDDEGRAATLEERIKWVNELSKADTKSEKLAEIFSPRPMTEDRLEKLSLGMFKNFRPSLLETEDDE